MSKKRIYVASFPLKTGILEYDTEELLVNLPKGFKVLNPDDPDIDLISDEIFFTWQCVEDSASVPLSDEDRKAITEGIVGFNKPRNSR